MNDTYYGRLEYARNGTDAGKLEAIWSSTTVDPRTDELMGRIAENPNISADLWSTIVGPGRPELWHVRARAWFNPSVPLYLMQRPDMSEQAFLLLARLTMYCKMTDLSGSDDPTIGLSFWMDLDVSRIRQGPEGFKCRETMRLAKHLAHLF